MRRIHAEAVNFGALGVKLGAMENPDLPEKLSLELERAEALRYGENPHQKAALYLDPNTNRPGAARAKKVQGKELSYNNLLDADAAFECVAEFTEPAIVIVKHLNPCGVAVGANLKEAYAKALACDPVSAFGGIVAANKTLDAETARELTKIFLEVIIVPDAEAEALNVLSEKPNIRVLLTGSMPDKSEANLVIRSIAGGVLVQSRDNSVLEGEVKTVTKRAPAEAEMRDLTFAFTVCKHVKSNAIVYAKNGATLGIGAGQMSRIYSAKIAAIKAEDTKLSLRGSVMASDAFMPFPDVVEEAARAGVSAIIQPGGSKNDQASIDAADNAGIAMVFTGVRHFRH
ncbi:bifunctional phosphoribosylaminoimidazolecarboxamide formyltransferase/IMP cyclohydrolase PurH [Candidatus Parcubacteria bacterium]|nr:MAG: bifunctional phosphoribosylaminoimidazolecarboxamide formyltransferase/IMP cyclohydrolase PurH [Candidatus Parcubacteria bacterium]